MMREVHIDRTFWIAPEDRVRFYLNNQQSFEIDTAEFERVKQASFWNRKEMRLVSYDAYKNTPLHWLSLIHI